MSATFRNPETQLGLRQCASLSVASSQPGSPGRPERLQGDNLGDNQKPLAAPDQNRAVQLGARLSESQEVTALPPAASRQTDTVFLCLPIVLYGEVKKKWGGVLFSCKVFLRISYFSLQS